MPENTVTVPIAGPGAATPAAPAETPTTPETPAAPEGAEIPRELSPLERFHPSLDPSKVELAFDEHTGRVKVIPKAPVEDAPVEELAEEAPAFEAPAAPAATETPTSEVQQLRSELAQMTQLVTVMAQAQMQGKSLAEALGAPAQPTEPDYSGYDLYDTDQRAAFIRQLRQDVKSEVMREHQPTMEMARRQQEYNTISTRYGGDPAFQQKAVAAIQLVERNPQLTIVAAYEQVNLISQTLAPQPAQTATVATQQPAAKQAQRTTLTPEQQAQKAEQAKKLPQQGSGVRGAGMPNLPKNIKGLGNIRAWVAQQAQLGNL